MREQQIAHEIFLAHQQKADSLQRAMDLAEINADSAMGAYDPNGTKLYRGIAIGSEMIETELESLTNGKVVGFKKRKSTVSGGIGGGSGRKIRSSGED